MVSSNWNKPRNKAPSRQRRDALRLLKFNAAKTPLQQQSSVAAVETSASPVVAETSSNTESPATASTTSYLLSFSQATVAVN